MNPNVKRKCSVCKRTILLINGWEVHQKSYICPKCLSDTEKLQEYYNKLEKKRRYRKGDRITSIDELLSQEFVYWNNKITHKGWFGSWQLRMTANAIKNGSIYKAIKKESEEI